MHDLSFAQLLGGSLLALTAGCGFGKIDAPPGDSDTAEPTATWDDSGEPDAESDADTDSDSDADTDADADADTDSDTDADTDADADADTETKWPEHCSHPYTDINSKTWYLNNELDIELSSLSITDWVNGGEVGYAYFNIRAVYDDCSDLTVEQLGTYVNTYAAGGSGWQTNIDNNDFTLFNMITKSVVSVATATDGTVLSDTGGMQLRETAGDFLDDFVLVAGEIYTFRMSFVATPAPVADEWVQGGIRERSLVLSDDTDTSVAVQNEGLIAFRQTFTGK